MIGNRRGQIVVEYILLLLVAVTVAAVLIRGLASRSESDPGIIVERWLKVQEEIGSDLPDRCTGTQCNN